MTESDFFYVRALYDAENDLYYSESNIDGLHLEADTLEEFWKEAHIWSADLLQENHGITAGKVTFLGAPFVEASPAVFDFKSVEVGRANTAF